MSERPNSRQIDRWKAAEQNAADWMRHWGFHDARVTAPGSDGGIDVRSSRALAQVKMEAQQVGRPMLNRLVGARGHEHSKALIFFSGAGYSSPAIAYADDMGIALFKYALDGSMTPVNGAARRITASSHTATVAPARIAKPSRPTTSPVNYGCAILIALWATVATIGVLVYYVTNPRTAGATAVLVLFGGFWGIVALLFWAAVLTLRPSRDARS